MLLQVTLFCHAATRAIRRVAFPDDEPIEQDDAAKAMALAASMRRVDVAWTSPAISARQTAAALRLDAASEPALREIDYGCWASRLMTEINASDPAGLAAWLSDPGAAPHGGETIDSLFSRTATWLNSLSHGPTRVVAVTHASVMRAVVVAALDAPRHAFWRIDVAPLYRLSMQGRPGRWTIRSLGPVRPDRTDAVRAGAP